MKEQTIYHLSSDYQRLFELICHGHRIAGWVDSYNMTDLNDRPLRDICEIKRRDEFEIMISCRGTSYGDIFPFMSKHGTEESVFIQTCSRCNLLWIDPSPALGNE